MKHLPIFASGRSIPSPAIKTRSTQTPHAGNGQTYAPIKTKFRFRGFDYRQIAREGDVAIYSQTWTGCANPSVCYEVVRIRCKDEIVIKDKYYPPAEWYPSSSEWGTRGWTFCDKDAAFAKLRELTFLEAVA